MASVAAVAPVAAAEAAKVEEATAAAMAEAVAEDWVGWAVGSIGNHRRWRRKCPRAPQMGAKPRSCLVCRSIPSTWVSNHCLRQTPLETAWKHIETIRLVAGGKSHPVVAVAVAVRGEDMRSRTLVEHLKALWV